MLLYLILFFISILSLSLLTMRNITSILPMNLDVKQTYPLDLVTHATVLPNFPKYHLCGIFLGSVSFICFIRNLHRRFIDSESGTI